MLPASVPPGQLRGIVVVDTVGEGVHLCQGDVHAGGNRQVGFRHGACALPPTCNTDP